MTEKNEEKELASILDYSREREREIVGNSLILFWRSGSAKNGSLARYGCVVGS